MSKIFFLLFLTTLPLKHMINSFLHKANENSIKLFCRRIMMLTVIKNTKNPVKFWFLKNYLSPTIKVK